MAIAQTITVVDGKTYQPGEEIWDLGSFACVDVRGISEAMRDYRVIYQNFRIM